MLIENKVCNTRKKQRRLINKYSADSKKKKHPLRNVKSKIYKPPESLFYVYASIHTVCTQELPILNINF